MQKAVFALLGNAQALPTSPDATDALAAAVCHCHTSPLAAQIQTQLAALAGGRRKSGPRSWRQVSVASLDPERVVGGPARGRG